MLLGNRIKKVDKIYYTINKTVSRENNRKKYEVTGI